MELLTERAEVVMVISDKIDMKFKKFTGIMKKAQYSKKVWYYKRTCNNIIKIYEAETDRTEEEIITGAFNPLLVMGKKFI